jgi:hypothetical protein
MLNYTALRNHIEIDQHVATHNKVEPLQESHSYIVEQIEAADADMLLNLSVDGQVLS